MSDFIEFILQPFLEGCLVIKGTGVILWQTMGVAVYETTLAFHAQQACLFVAVEASLFILLFDWRILVFLFFF